MATGYRATFASLAGTDVTETVYQLAGVPHAPGTLVCRVCLTRLIAVALAVTDDAPNGIAFQVEHLPAFDPNLN